MIDETALMEVLREMHGVLTDMNTIQTAMLERIVELEERVSEAERLRDDAREWLKNQRMGEKQ